VQRAEQKVVNLALQGGGSQLSPGACSTALLEEETLHFEGISGNERRRRIELDDEMGISPVPGLDRADQIIEDALNKRGREFRCMSPVSAYLF